MPVHVVDASALGALVFAEPRAEEMARVLANVPLAAPALLWFEMASMALHKIRIHPLQKAQIMKAFALGLRLAIEVVEIDHAEIIEMAHKANLSTYDASYLWLAHHLDGELITLDQRLRKAATRFL